MVHDDDGSMGMAVKRVLRGVWAMLGALLFAVEAQPAASSMQTVAVLTPHREDAAYPVLLQTLRQLGHEEGRNLRLLVRSADWKCDRLPALALELVEARPDVIVAVNTQGRALRSAPLSTSR